MSAPGSRTQLQKLSGDPNPQHFLKSIAVQMGGVLPCQWEAYCNTNGGWRCTFGFPFLNLIKAQKPRRYSDTNGGRTAVQIRGVLQCCL